MRYKGCHQAHKAQVVICAIFTTHSSSKLQGRRKAFSPIRKVRAISQKLCSHSGTTAVTTPPAVSSIGGLRTPAPVRAAPPPLGPTSANLHRNRHDGGQAAQKEHRAMGASTELRF